MINRSVNGSMAKTIRECSYTGGELSVITAS